MGLVTVEEPGALKPGGEVKAAMYDRFVMSTTTFDDLAGRMSLLRGQLKLRD
jgi:hypothetical protein